jgi:hypothetical protein
LNSINADNSKGIINDNNSKEVMNEPVGVRKFQTKKKAYKIEK